MIRIKVCKLSDLTSRAVLILLSCLFVFFFCQFTKKIIQPFSIDFIQLAIQKNLCFQTKNPLWEELIYSNLPIFSIQVQDDIEKEFYMVDNLENSNTQKFDSSIKIGDEQIDNKNEMQRKDNIIQSKETLKVPYLLEYEKISSGKYKIGDVTINDYTKKILNFAELEKALFIEIEKDCKILIYHTHTSESYTGTSSDNNYHSEDQKSNVIRVGEELKKELNQYGIMVRQDSTYHDYPSYNGAYKSSLKTVENILKNENYDIIIDIHRDALASNTAYRPTAEINGETVAKLMFVVGTNAAGLKHDDWIENLKFAIAFQQRANELFPGLFRDLHLSTSRYNQHTSKKSLILEVGATGNTIEEACLAMKYFAKVLNAMRGK